MRTTMLYPVLCTLALAAACSDDPTGPRPLLDPAAGPQTPPLVVISRNLYVGADLDAVIAALVSPDPADDGPALQLAIQTLQQTAFPARAEALADEITRNAPAAVGLQEVSTLEVPGLPTIAFLPILQAALVARGLSYTAVASVTNFDLSVPLGPGVFARLADQEVLLVADGLTVLATGQGLYAQNLPLGFATISRGWVSADLAVAGKTIRVVSTHLESGSGLPGLVRQAQAAELAGMVGATSLPVILMGDLNDGPGSVMHQILTGAGLLDVWAERNGVAPGFTCCHASDLSNADAGGFNQRLDYVMVRGGFTTGSGRLVGGARIEIIGEEAGDRILGPFGAIWPSDHAGLVASLPPAR